ncbi:hypothetical protein R3P38DRAFT_2794119 [Favolaschia claudopus]|uniref:Uncharacterized protein n=1 Tax=Favolaschia claudopus TaxID=2862362 RepID=A0AAW0AAZ8_9AGAR
MQFTTTLKALVFAAVCLIPSIRDSQTSVFGPNGFINDLINDPQNPTLTVPIAAGPTLADSDDSVAKKKKCCDPDFFYPCMTAQLLGCNPDNINLCSYQAEQDCLALCVGKPGATPSLCKN